MVQIQIKSMKKDIYTFIVMMTGLIWRDTQLHSTQIIKQQQQQNKLLPMIKTTKTTHAKIDKKYLG